MRPNMKIAAKAVGMACLLFGLGMSARPAQADDLRIVASIKPVHSLVAGVTEGVAKPVLLLKGSASPHSHALAPSDAAALESADVVFWVGENFELFLTRTIETLADDTTVTALARSPGLTLYERRAGGLWEDEDHDHDVDETRHDGHIWLDPHNAAVMVNRIAEVLSDLDPANFDIYQSNARRLMDQLAKLDAEIEQTLKPVTGVPYIVFHDAFQYFERRYGLAAAGSITANPDQPPGARRLQELRAAIIDRRAACVFREPNFEPTLVQSMAEGTSARTGVLDPEGVLLPAGTALYFDLMRGMAASLKECLSASN